MVSECEKLLENAKIVINGLVKDRHEHLILEGDMMDEILYLRLKLLQVQGFEFQNEEIINLIKEGDEKYDNNNRSCK